MPISSHSSRAKASSKLSPGSTFPPGYSQSPHLRRARNTSPRRQSAPATTEIRVPGGVPAVSPTAPTSEPEVVEP